MAAEHALDEFAAAGADEAIESDDLAFAHFNRDIVKTLAGEPFGREDRRADRDGVLVIDLFDRAVDHQRDQGGFVRFVDAAGADERAVAQDRDAVAELEHLLEPMADIDDGDAIGLEPPDQLGTKPPFPGG